ncbi:hypothetical protein L596_012224 [Steinernema carpocapsae]|uniref:MADF domain-containing protein n=1 Tax=Steinernema carpocapsae TaxID=34508 RepID=A0A4U5NXA3_STECR|nr:hypothetical protein L596_012224 [Steinernema carpocapsae]
MSTFANSANAPGVTVESAKNALIDYVRDNPILWDSHHLQYKDFELKQGMWEDCAHRLVELGYPCVAEDLPKQWKNLVDYYRHLKKKSNCGTAVRWCHYQAMTFLDRDYSTERPKSRSSPPMVVDGPPMKIVKREAEEEIDVEQQLMQFEPAAQEQMTPTTGAEVDTFARSQSDPVLEDVLGFVPMLRRVRNASITAYDNIIVEIHSEVLKTLRKTRAENGV